MFHGISWLKSKFFVRSLAQEVPLVRRRRFLCPVLRAWAMLRPWASRLPGIPLMFRKTHRKMGKHRNTHRKMEVYPLVNSHITMKRSTMLLMGKSTISMAIFNRKLLNCQRVNFITTSHRLSQSLRIMVRLRKIIPIAGLNFYECRLVNYYDLPRCFIIVYPTGRHEPEFWPMGWYGTCIGLRWFFLIHWLTWYCAVLTLDFFGGFYRKTMFPSSIDLWPRP